MRRKNIEKQVLEKQRDIALKQQKTVVLLAANEECEQQLLSVMKTRLNLEAEVPYEEIRGAQLADFAKCTVPLLKAFIHVRMFDTLTVPSSAKWSWPNKEKLADAENGVDCLIKRAFDCRRNDLKLVAIDPATIQVPAPLVPVPPTIAQTVEQQVPTASVFLADSAWVIRVGEAFAGGASFLKKISDIHLREGDILYKIVKARFSWLMNTRLLDRRLHRHECIVFIRWNLPRMSAVLIVTRQVQDDLGTTTKDDTILRENEGAFINAIGDASNLQGNYLYKDIRRCRLVRSGKAVGFNQRTGKSRSIGDRHKEHLKSSLNDKSGSFFYTSYPHRDSTVPVSDVICRGNFQDLVQLVGLGFDRTQPGVVEKLCSSEADKGIFHWSNATKELVGRTNFKDSDVFEHKQLQYVGYLTEISHGMLICDRNNVSKSFGCETPLGLFPQ